MRNLNWMAFGLALCGLSARASDFEALQQRYASRIQPILTATCLECHSTDKAEGELDLERFDSVSKVRQSSATWLKVIEMLKTREMPPRDSKQLTSDQLKELRQWLDDFVLAEADATAGDPGPVMLRRLNNVEYTHSIQALTGQPLEPAREFPADSAAGEGFTNTGNSLVMSPALLSKYMDAGKQVAEHAILLPDGLRFSKFDTRRDWTDDVLSRLRAFYARYTDASGSTRVNLQGLEWDTNAGGRLPLPTYLSLLLEAREQLRAGNVTPTQLADQHKLNAKYMSILWSVLDRPQNGVLLTRIQNRFATLSLAELPQFIQEIAAWQTALTRFQSVGHMKPWLAEVEPIVQRQDLRAKCDVIAGSDAVVLQLAAGSAGDPANDFVVWQQPRLVKAGRVDIPLRDLPLIAQHFSVQQQHVHKSAERCLQAIDEYLSSGSTDAPDSAALGAKHNVAPDVLEAWIDYLSISPSGPVRLDRLFTNQLLKGAGYDFVNGWGSPETPSVMASSGDTHVRIPGNMKPHGVVVHPAPALNVVVSWRSPINGTIQIDGTVTHAHPECGNGVTWAIELRRGHSRQRLAAGVAHGGQPVKIPTIQNQPVRTGELVSLLVGPRDGNHSCDLTDVEFKLREQVSEGQAKSWNLTSDVSPNIMAGNPHADQYGHSDTWSFYGEPVQAGEANRAVVPNESLLGKWLATSDSRQRGMIAAQVQRLLIDVQPAQAGADRELWEQTHSANGPLLGSLLDRLAQAARSSQLKPLDRTTLAKVIDGHEALNGSINGFATVEPSTRPDKNQWNDAAWSGPDVVVVAPHVLTLRLPASLCAGRDLVVGGALDDEYGKNGCVQLQVRAGAEADGKEAPPLTPALPLIVQAGSATRGDLVSATKAFREVFPAALCYTKIVPVDEVVTLALFHREDDNLVRLMLNDSEKAELDNLWQELHFVSNDLLTVEDAYEQLMQFATQDGDPRLFEHLRQPIKRRADEYRASLLAAEPSHVKSVIDLAERAFRRPLRDNESAGLKSLYQQLREEGLSHEASIRLLIARVLVSSSFLYRLEKSPAGDGASPVSDWETASRLSYFLWSGPPDQALLDAARSGQLHTQDTIAAQAERMLQDQRVERLASQFACQWLHIQDIATLDEKSERHFPEFAGIRQSLQTEAELFFTDLFRNDGSVLDVFDADHTFLNEGLAKFYGIEGVEGNQWRRVDKVREAGRGGVLTMGATLAKQSGASRTSPILRGNWVSEVLLGEKLPKPPKNVPPLPTDEAVETLTVRQLVERHSSDERCSNCHQRIDPFGFALESFDAIGRIRKADLAGRIIDAAVTLPDGTKVSDAKQLRAYLIEQKRDVLVKQFCRKLLGYALGRSVQLSDEKLLGQMNDELKRHDYRVSVAVDAIVRSQQFTHIRNTDE